MCFGRTIGVLALLLLAGCGDNHQGQPDNARPTSTSTGEIDWFTDRGKDAGIDFVHINGMSGQFYMTEIMAPGVALFDYDNDGDLDIYLVQGSRFEVQGSGLRAQGANPDNAQGGSGQGRLYRNDLEIRAEGTRRRQFTGVTDQNGIVSRDYG